MHTPEKIRTEAMATAQGPVFRWIAAGAAVQMILAGALILADGAYPRWRLGVVLALSVLTVAFAGAELVVERASYDGPRRIVYAVGSVVCFAAIVGVSEGLGSPLTPLMLHPLIGQSSRHGRSSSAPSALVAVLVCVVILAVVPGAWTGPRIAEPYRTWVWAVMLSGVVITMFVSLSKTRAAYARASGELGEMREAILRDHAARARGLETIGAKVAHELKNPLTSVKALLELMGEDAPDTERERFDVLGREVRRMQTILADYLSFSRPLEVLRTAAIDLAALATQTARVIEARADDARVRLRVTGESAEVVADAERLRAVLLNLIGNAIEASSAGDTVTVHTEPTDGGARITVADTGRGMNARELASIGKPFFSTKPEGTGLGVVIAIGTVRQHGGDLTFDSTPGQGTTATVTLPATATSPPTDPSKSYDKISHLDRDAKTRLQGDESHK